MGRNGATQGAPFLQFFGSFGSDLENTHLADAFEKGKEERESTTAAEKPVSPQASRGKGEIPFNGVDHLEGLSMSVHLSMCTKVRVRHCARGRQVTILGRKGAKCCHVVANCLKIGLVRRGRYLFGPSSQWSGITEYLLQGYSTEGRHLGLRRNLFPNSRRVENR